MTTDWKHTFRRIAIQTGKGLLWLGKHLLALLAAIARFVFLRAIPALWRWLRDTAFPALRRLYLWLPHRRAVVGGIAAVVAIAIAVLMWRTPGDMGTETAPGAAIASADVSGTPAEPVRLTLSPAEASPGAPVLLDGLAVAANDTFEVWIGDQPAIAERLPDGRLQALVPLQLGPDGWPVALAQAQVVEVRRNGRPIATSGSGLRVTELPRAPGTTVQVQQSLETITAAYARIFEALPVQDESETAHRRAVIAMLRALVSEGDHSLAAVLAGTSPLLEGGPVDLELTDALLAASGAAAYLQARAAVFEAPPAAAAGGTTIPAGAAFPMLLSMQGWLPPDPGVPKCRETGKDVEIACLMQVHGLLTLFSQEFVKPTADTYATGVGLSMGAYGLNSDVVKIAGKSVPVHKVISALLSVANLVIEKIAPSLLPASLSRFELEVATPLIRTHETTRTRLMVEARNHPQTITLNDLVDLVKSIIGLPKIDQLFQNKVFQVFDYAVDIYLAVLREFGGAMPGVENALNPGVFTMPAMQWGPVEVASDDLLSLFSYDEQVLSTQEPELEWRGERAGQATVRVMPRGPGDRSKMLLDNTLCWGCAWSGGAFGEDMPESSKKIAVDIEFKASPRQGHPPLDVEFTWRLLAKEDGEPIPCTLDFGDGSQPERIADCTEINTFEHTYLYTSRLEADTAGSYEPTIRLDGNKAEGKTEVTTEWTFRGEPATGNAPLDAWFTWHIPWPSDREAPACELDPGDGSEKQTFDDCLATTQAEHRFERRGSFVPMLTLIDGNARDTKTAPVSVAEPGTCDEDLLKHKTWTGTVSYNQKRDAWNESGTSHIKYSMDVRLGADMHERTRRQWRGADHLVQYYSPLPQGSANLSLSSRGYDSKGNLLGINTFNGTGPMQRQEPRMTEDGSSLTLTLDTNDCSYEFHLQGQTKGSGERWNWIKGSESYQGHMWINSVWGEGVVTSNSSIQGSGTFPVLSRSQIEDNSRQKTNWVSEDDGVSRNLGEDNLGTITVDWHFDVVD
ncbi:PKD domain-containing protein [Luteimonas sp. A611]